MTFKEKTSNHSQHIHENRMRKSLLCFCCYHHMNTVEMIPQRIALRMEIDYVIYRTSSSSLSDRIKEPLSCCIPPTFNDLEHMCLLHARLFASNKTRFF